MSLREVVRWGQTFIPSWAQESWWDARQWAYRALRQPHESELGALAELGLEPDARVLDVGANRGQSIDAVKLFLPQARIVAVEPSQRLGARLRARYPDVRVVQVAAGSVEGWFTLYTPSYRNFRYDG